MSDWKPRRFWKTASAAPASASHANGGFAVLLDDRPLRTPAKATLVVPTMALAQAIAAEWQAQEGKVDPETMPLTRAANAAIDKVARQQAAVAAHLAEYGGTDLLCYRAALPPELAARQAAAWDPLLDWLAARHDAPLVAVQGVIHHPQPPESLRRLHGRVAALDPFTLTGFHDLVGLSGSLVLALAVIDGRLTPEAAWDASRLDEDWQEEQWGADEIATGAAAAKRAGFLAAARFVMLCRA